jgi:glycosyltransferase involved in cell wall biosynthesis
MPRHAAEQVPWDPSYSVHWRVPVGCGFSGFFTEVALGYLPALHKLGARVRLLSGRCEEAWLRSHLDSADAAVLRSQWMDEQALTDAQTANALTIEHGEPCGIRTWPPRHPGRPWRVVARAMSEGDLSANNARCLAGVDEVWVPTQWHVDRFVAAGVRRDALHVLPETVDTDFFSPEVPEVLAARAARGGDAPFTFVSVFKWEQRKGWDLLLDAYWQEFAREAREGGRAGVVLRVKTYLPGWEPGPRDLNQHIAQHARARHGAARESLPPVELHLEDAPRAQIRSFYASADAFVLPTRGEGWGLPICEAMAMGVPPIATNFSGPSAFLTPTNSHPLPVARALPGGFAEPSIGSIRKAMRAAYEERGDGRGAQRGAAARADMVRRFSHAAVGQLLLERLRAVFHDRDFGGEPTSQGGGAGGSAGDRSGHSRRSKRSRTRKARKNKTREGKGGMGKDEVRRELSEPTST